MKISIIKKILTPIIIALIWLVIWQGIYMLIDNPLFVSAPIDVFKRIFELAKTSLFWKDVYLSVYRILIGFIFGVLIGLLMAFVTSISVTEKLFSPLKVIIRATPIASFIMLAWIWLERDMIPVFISSLMVIPVVWGNVSTGIKNIDKDFKELAKVYKIKKSTQFKNIYLPGVLPYFTTALCTCAGLVWKAGVAAEVLCQPKNSIGSNLFYAKSILETVDVFAWTTVVIIISLALEMLIKFILKKLEKKFMFAGLT